jgi:hypothetical protein
MEICKRRKKISDPFIHDKLFTKAERKAHSGWWSFMGQ